MECMDVRNVLLLKQKPAKTNPDPRRERNNENKLIFKELVELYQPKLQQIMTLLVLLLLVKDLESGFLTTSIQWGLIVCLQ